MAFRTVTEAPRKSRWGVDSPTGGAAPARIVLHHGATGGPVRRRRDRRSGAP
jgi:hypothetical protein